MDESAADRFRALVETIRAGPGDPARQLRLAGEALQLAQAAGRVDLAARARLIAASALLDAGDLEGGLPLLEQALAAGREVDDLAIVFVNRINRAAALVLAGQQEAGLAELCACRTDPARDPASTALNMALYEVRALRELGRPDEARAAGHAAIAEAGPHPDRRPLADLHLELTTLEAGVGAFEVALDHHRRFHALHAAALNERALQRSAVAAVQLQTERALVEAALHRARTQELVQTVQDLTHRVDAADHDALTDALTGLPNRRSLDRHIGRIVAGTEAGGAACRAAIALIDVDHFKAVNDRFGHAVGDAVLQELARLLARETRSGDAVGRYGGEEFVAVLDGADFDQAARICERMRATVAAHAWERLHEGLAVTISIGFATASAICGAADTLQAADRALYRAKREGRNRVMCAVPGEPMEAGGG